MASSQDESKAPLTSAFRFRVEGVMERQTWLPAQADPFDETYEIEGEHPAHALEKLLHEIEWGILNGYEAVHDLVPG